MPCSLWHFESRESALCTLHPAPCTAWPQVPHGFQTPWFLSFLSEGIPYFSLSEKTLAGSEAGALICILPQTCCVV